MEILRDSADWLEPIRKQKLPCLSVIGSLLHTNQPISSQEEAKHAPTLTLNPQPPVTVI